MSLISPVKWLILTLPFLKGIFCSVGDNSPFYYKCVRSCRTEICDAGKHSAYQYNFLGFGFSLWSCLENCQYKCQWQTVEAFERKNWPIPQFNGKWPFIRFLGFQEPASVMFSVLNFLVILKYILLFNKRVDKSSPFYYVWNGFALVQMNAWLWSCVYHSRDTPITEKMDYMAAFLAILYLLYGAGLRYIVKPFSIKGIIWFVLCYCLGLNHLTYLWFYNFDYGYNMKLNVAVGNGIHSEVSSSSSDLKILGFCCFVGGIAIGLWILWSFLHYKSQPHVWNIFLFSVSSAFSTLLELMDFPPIFWVFDAHALWHGSTALLSIFFYLFAIDDCHYLSKQKGLQDSKLK